MKRRPKTATLFPCTTLSRSQRRRADARAPPRRGPADQRHREDRDGVIEILRGPLVRVQSQLLRLGPRDVADRRDRALGGPGRRRGAVEIWRGSCRGRGLQSWGAASFNKNMYLL